MVTNLWNKNLSNKGPKIHFIMLSTVVVVPGVATNVHQFTPLGNLNNPATQSWRLVMDLATKNLLQIVPEEVIHSWPSGIG